MTCVYRKCPYCKGKLTKKCLNCKGTGKIKINVEGQKARCPECNGVGFKICPWCKGKLQIEK